MSDAIEAACRAYLLERDIDPDYPHGLKPGATAWWKTEVPAMTAAITAYEAAECGGAGVKPGATAWENIHNGAIRRVEPNDPENYIALGPVTSPANGARDAVIEVAVDEASVCANFARTADDGYLVLVARLREACNGHPHAKIAWPHRVLHEAADALSSLVRERDEAREAAYDQPHGPTSRILWSTRYSELLDDYKDLQAENEKMRKALTPFAREADARARMALGPDIDDWPIGGSALTLGDLRRARNALGGKDE